MRSQQEIRDWEIGPGAVVSGVTVRESASSRAQDHDSTMGDTGPKYKQSEAVASQQQRLKYLLHTVGVQEIF